MEEKANNTNNKRKKIGLIVLGIVVLVAAVALFLYLNYKSTHITTDDAFIEGDIHTVASKVSGTVRNVYVKSNQRVGQGDLLVELDDVDYSVKKSEASSSVEVQRARLSEAEARIDVAKSRLAEFEAALEAAKANLRVEEATYEQNRSDCRRAENLFRKESISRDRYEKMLTSCTVADARMEAARKRLVEARESLNTQREFVKQMLAARKAQGSEIDEKEARLKAADLNYGYTRIYSPSVGYVTRKAVEIGNQITAGQPLMAVVPLHGLYVTANYKETQIRKIRPGQKVEIEVDTYPGKKFTGRVDSIMAGTGAVFSLFPPENATGNYVKVVQRIPVKILLDENTDKDHILRVGMSVVPTIILE